MVYRGAAKVIEPDTYQTHDFDSWADLATADENRTIHTIRLSIPVPEVILLTHHDRAPSRQVPFSRRNLFRRDGNQCQYCGRKFSSEDLSIDHVLPKSKGGKTNWENCVLACLKCNVRKGSRSLGEVGMRLLRPVARPTWSPCLSVRIGRRRPCWEKFVSEQYWNVTLDED